MELSGSLTVLADGAIHTSDKNLGGNTIAAVVFTGLAVVFIALVILIFLVWLYGKIFAAVNNKAKQKADAEKAALEKVNKPAAPKSAPAAAAPAPVTDGVEEETVAVIMAAISAYGAQTGKKLAVRSIKPSGGGAQRRNAWSAAGLAEATRPF